MLAPGTNQTHPTVWTLTVIMIAVFVYELIVNSKAQGTPVSFKVRFAS